MKKKIVAIMFTVAALSLVGCSINDDSASNSSYDNSYTTNDDSDNDSSYSSSSSSSSSSYDDSDSDYSSSYSSGSSSSSSSSSSIEHYCDASGCSKEGTHELTGLDGSPEYYCTEHYNQLVDIVNELYGN